MVPVPPPPPQGSVRNARRAVRPSGTPRRGAPPAAGAARADGRGDLKRSFRHGAAGLPRGTRSFHPGRGARKRAAVPF